MKVEEAKLEFVQTWGSLGSSWGIPKSMAQIHALLLASEKAFSTEEIMETIKLSRGNVNINLRELSNWKLVTKVNKIGERKEFFKAEYDVWTLAKNIASERKKRELEPISEFLTRMKTQKLEGDKEDIKHFKSLVKDLSDLVQQMEKLTDILVRMNENAFFQKVITLMK